MTSLFSQPSTLPFELPPLATLTADDLVQGVREGIAEHAAQVEAIAVDPSPATFENTFVALERSGATLRRAVQAAFLLIPTLGTDELQAAEVTLTEALSAHEDAVLLDPALTERLSSVDLSGLDDEDARLAEVTLRRRRLAGAELDEAQRATLTELNARISAASTAYGQRVGQDMRDAAVLLSTEEARGLDEDRLDSTAAAAREAGHEEGHLISLLLPSSQPALEALEDEAARRRLHEASVDRGSKAPEGTLTLAVEIARLRAERAALLGYRHHAELTLAERSETDLEKVEALLGSAVDQAVANARAEDERIAAWQGSETRPWDRARGLAALGADEGGVDPAAVREYFELDRVITEGVFRAATLVYGLGFVERTDLPLHHPEARAWEVHDADGTPLGLFIGDYFARPTKRGGAWMDELVTGNTLLGQKPVVTNTLNIPHPAPGRPALCTWDEVHTLFHEFGHALHGLLTTVRYPSLAGTAVPRDIVEYPSQVNELWASHPDVLPHYARHVVTGEPLPQDLVAALQSGSTWGEGFATTEYLAAALLDLAWHRLTPEQDPGDPLDFEHRALTEAGFDPDAVPPRYRTGYFQHIFESGYSAGYYSYFWAEVLDADTVQWFKEQPDVRAAGETFRREFLSRGDTRDTLASYRAFRGRDPRTEPLLRRRGLA